MSEHSVNRRVVASTVIVMAGILLSRVLGFVREWVVAHQVGSNAMTDAYYAAFIRDPEGNRIEVATFLTAPQ